MISDIQVSNADRKKGSYGDSYLSSLAVIALSFGYAVGWGAFVLPGTVFLPNAGPAGTIIGFLIGTIAIIVLAYNYHKMAMNVQSAGGAYGYVTKIFGFNHAFLVGWFLVLTYIAIMWANATALVLLARYLFGDALQFGFHYAVLGFDVYLGEVLLCLSAILLCGYACILSRKFAIRLHTFCAFALFAGVVVCFTAALCRHEGGLAAMAPAFSDEDPAAVQILRILAMVPWAFVGFEAVVQSSTEFRFPMKRTFGLLLTAILISAAVYIILVLLPILALPEGYSNWEAYIIALPGLEGIDSMPVFSAARKVLGPLGTAIIGGSMLSGQLTALFATYIAVSRLVRAMSDDDMFPKWLGKCNSEGTPVNAIVAVMCISLPIPFLGRTVTGWPVDLSNLGAAIAYGYISAAALSVLKKEGSHPFGKFAAVFGIGMSIIFSLLTLVPNYLSGSSFSTESYLFLSIWCFAGFLLYRPVFIRDTTGRFGHSTVVWITVLVAIFFSSLMWFRLAICDAAEYAYSEFLGKTITEETIHQGLAYVNTDVQIKSIIELCILFSSLAIILNLFSTLRKREKNLIVEKLEAEESASRSKSYFFSTISHDIRTPLNAVIGYSQVLKMGTDQEEEREQALNSIMANGRTLLRLIDDAIDFAKLEDGQLEFEPKPVNYAGLLLKFTDSFRNSRQIRSIDLRCLPGKMPTVLIDPKRIRQILFNLVDNAVKFTQHGFVEVRGTFEQTDDSKGTLRLEVEDTGCGISAADLKLIASPYVQVDSKMARHGGTGIGLAVCYKLVEAMGGELSIDSVLGKGSTFAVTIPNVEITDEAPVEEEVPVIPGANIPPQEPAAVKKEEPAKAAGTKRVLIADDQKVNLIVLRTLLNKIGTFDIVMAKDGQEALDLLTSADPQFDLVLTDMWMPVMDGEKLVRAIRADARLAKLPVHVVTADTELPGKFREIGFDGIILKPVTVEKLKETVC